jgi:hypothetical protein
MIFLPSSACILFRPFFIIPPFVFILFLILFVYSLLCLFFLRLLFSSFNLLQISLLVCILIILLYFLPYFLLFFASCLFLSSPLPFLLLIYLPLLSILFHPHSISYSFLHFPSPPFFFYLRVCFPLLILPLLLFPFSSPVIPLYIFGRSF